ITALNQMSQEEFVAVLGGVFEKTPAIAAQAWHLRPFQDGSDLAQKMLGVMWSMSDADQLSLLRAHPDLGSKVKMTDASVQEQTAAGLNQLTAEEYEQFHALNRAYQEKFGFPFIVAVKNHTKLSILDTFHQRLGNIVEVEREQALIEISHIVQFRLTELLGALPHIATG
ncbi:MAG TPA: 2-oxo-4-hydroxy-4-carboxy-5-ureidoimidazoline decarboxylase, partial [Allocoleopsis sp.]